MPEPRDYIRLGLLDTYRNNDVLMRTMEQAEVTLEVPFLNVWCHPMFQRGWTYVTGRDAMSIPLPFDSQDDEEVASDISLFLEGDQRILEEKVVGGGEFSGKQLQLIFDISGGKYERVLERLQGNYEIQRV